MDNFNRKRQNITETVAQDCQQMHWLIQKLFYKCHESKWPREQLQTICQLAFNNVFEIIREYFCDHITGLPAYVQNVWSDTKIKEKNSWRHQGFG